MRRHRSNALLLLRVIQCPCPSHFCLCLVQHDGAITADAAQALTAVTRSLKHPNGCPVSATLFSTVVNIGAFLCVKAHRCC